MTSRVGIMAAGAIIAGTLAMAGTAFASGAPTVDLTSASYTVGSTGDLHWTITLQGLTKGDTVTFLAGPTSPPQYGIDQTTSASPVVETVTTTTGMQTFKFVSAPLTDTLHNDVQPWFLQADEQTTMSDILALGITGQLPEFPLAVAAPLVALGVGAWFVTRRRRAVRTRAV